MHVSACMTHAWAPDPLAASPALVGLHDMVVIITMLRSAIDVADEQSDLGIHRLPTHIHIYVYIKMYESRKRPVPPQAHMKNRQ